MRELTGRAGLWVRAVDGVSFDVKRGEVFCLVGESGCGKTTTGKTLLRLEEATAGDTLFEMPDADYERYRQLRRAPPTEGNQKELAQLRRRYSLSWQELTPWTTMDALFLTWAILAASILAIVVPVLLAPLLGQPFSSDVFLFVLCLAEGAMLGFVASLPPTRISPRTPAIVAVIALAAPSLTTTLAAAVFGTTVPGADQGALGALSTVWATYTFTLLVGILFAAAVAGGMARVQLSIRRESEGLVGIKMRALRRRLHLIFQDPYESLNPKQSVFEIVSEPLIVNKVSRDPDEIASLVSRSLEDAGLRPAEEFMFRFPHELSGGQRQRVSIAAALALEPDFIVADEPVSMLDVSIRTEILDLMMELRKRRGITYLFITHDLGLAWILADRIAVMYLGKIVEQGTADQVIAHPKHPYTQALISVVPSPDPRHLAQRTILQGERPDPVDIPKGCRFHPRCPVAFGPCGWSVSEVVQALRGARDELLQGGAELAAGTGVDPVSLENLRGATMARWPRSVELHPRPGVSASALSAAVRELAAHRRDKWRGLYGIASVLEDRDAVRVVLQPAVEPLLVQVAPWNSVACHLIAPPPAAAPAAVPLVTPAA